MIKKESILKENKCVINNNTKNKVNSHKKNENMSITLEDVYWKLVAK